MWAWQTNQNSNTKNRSVLTWGGFRRCWATRVPLELVHQIVRWDLIIQWFQLVKLAEVLLIHAKTGIARQHFVIPKELGQAWDVMQAMEPKNC